MKKRIFASKVSEIGQRNVPCETEDNNESFKAGGRVSPTESATTYSVGTVLTSDNDGQEWIIKADKNGRKSWKRNTSPAKDQKKLLKEIDIKTGRQFIDNTMMIWIIDSVKNDKDYGKIVKSSYAGGDKGNYSDSIKEVVAFLNEREAVAYKEEPKPDTVEPEPVAKPTNALKEKMKRLKAVGEINKVVDDLTWLYQQSQDQEARSEIRNETVDLGSVKMNIQKGEFNLKSAISQYFTAGQVTPKEAEKNTDFINEFTETPEFLEWFGNWMFTPTGEDSLQGQVSDVRHQTQRDGKMGYPILVWHGTTGPFSFNRFDMNKFPVMYFAENKSYAEFFAKMGSGIIYPAYLNIRWLFDLRGLGIERVTWSKIWREAKDRGVILPPKHPKLPANTMLPAWGWLRNDTPHNTLTNAVKKGGYTGMAHVEDNPSDKSENGSPRITDAFMTFRADQVKVPVEGGAISSYMNIFYMKTGGNIKTAKKSISSKLSKLRKK